jgi:hypothetical protein
MSIYSNFAKACGFSGDAADMDEAGLWIYNAACLRDDALDTAHFGWPAKVRVEAAQCSAETLLGFLVAHVEGCLPLELGKPDAELFMTCFECAPDTPVGDFGVLEVA